MDTLPLFHRIAGHPVIVVGEGEAADAKRRLVERAGGRCCGEDDAGARLAFVALPEPDDAAARLQARGVLVNVVDRPELCDFLTPSVLERGPLTIAVGSGGTLAGLSKALRLRLETSIPASLGGLATALADARQAIRARWPDPSDRRRALDAALEDGGSLDLFRSGDAAAVEMWLTDARNSAETITEFVLAGDDPDDLSLRQARLLGGADLLAYEPGIPATVLIRARADAVRIELAPGAAPPAHPGNVVVIRRS